MVDFVFRWKISSISDLFRGKKSNLTEYIQTNIFNAF